MFKTTCLFVLGLVLFQAPSSSRDLQYARVKDPLETQGCARFRVAFSDKSIRRGSNVRAYLVWEEAKNVRPIVFEWTISSGEIIKGQHTPSITIKTESVRETNLTVTVQVRFYPSNCESTASGSLEIRHPR